MKIAIIGAVAAGTSAAAQARRNDASAQIVLYDRDEYISYSGCGTPYYIGGDIGSFHSLAPRDAAYFKSKYNVDVFTRHEVLHIDSAKKELTIRNLLSGSVFADSYDILVIATGAAPIVPPIPGADSPFAFVLRTPSHALAIKRYLDRAKPKQSVIVGSGFIGLEMAESLLKNGLHVTVVEKLPDICPAVDTDMSAILRDYLTGHGVKIVAGRSAAQITKDSVVLDDGSSVSADLVLLSVGVRPDVRLAKAAGVALGPTGAIAVDSRMRTNLDGVYACGDCVELPSVVDGAKLYRPLGSTANKTGRVAGDAMTGGKLELSAIAGTSVFRVIDMAVASTGLLEREARTKGYDVATATAVRPDRSIALGGASITVKLIADRRTRRILGGQAVGFGGVDKRIDVLATAITFGAKADDLFHLDLAYAPPFSTANDPLHYAGLALQGALDRP